MKALVCHGPRANAWHEMPGRTLAADADAIVRADKTSAEPAWLSLPPAPGNGRCDSSPYLISPLFCPYGWHQVWSGISRSQRPDL